MQRKKDILKSNMIFGGAQVVQMFTTILRAKIIAILLGPSGIGLNAIIQSMLLMISNLSSCGIMQSSVREMSRTKDLAPDKLNIIIAVFRKFVLLAALIGLFICFLGAWPLSVFSLGDSNYINTFIALGIGVFFYIFTHGEMSVLQGTRHLSKLALSSIIGSVLNLLICIPCYYYFGVNGIIISIILGYFLYWLVYRYFVSKIGIINLKISFNEAFKEGKPIVTLGFILMIGSFLVSLFTYFTNVAIRIIGNLDDVGYYQGSASITTQSIVVVIAVLASDFYPRLSAVVDDKKQQNHLINQQLEIVVSIIVPIVSTVLCFSDFIIKTLLSDEFVVIVPLLRFMSISLLFRGIWITMSYVILANGDRKRYLIYDAIVGNGLNFVINVVAYYWGGLDFLGISYVVSSIVVAFVLYSVSYKSYQYRLDRNTIITLIIAFALISLSFYSISVNYCFAIFSTLFVIVASLINLIVRFDLLSILKIKK